MKSLNTVCGAALLWVVPSSCFGQMVAKALLPEYLPSAPSSTASAVSTTAKPTPPSPPWEPAFDRWVDLKEMDFSLRYRSVFDSNNAHEDNQGQQRSIVDGKFKFDAAGKYGLVFHASTGKYFNWAYADFMGGGNEHALDSERAKATPVQQDAIDAFTLTKSDAEIYQQEASGGWSFYVRRLYLDLEPIQGVEVQYGSMDINRGAATEITTYDNDGYIAGERLLIKRPKNFFFDEASVTYAYLGDLYTPNFFARGDRLAHADYHQFLLRKHVGKRVDASFDYTWQNASNTLREAALVNVSESRVLDSVRAEFYQRLNEISFSEVSDFVSGANGYAITGEKKAGKRISLQGGYAHIDPHQGVLTQSESSATLCMGINGDAYGLGNRYFVRPVIKLTPYLEAFGFYTHEIGTFSVVDQIVWNKEALNAGLTFDIKKALFPHAKVK